MDGGGSSGNDAVNVVKIDEHTREQPSFASYETIAYTYVCTMFASAIFVIESYIVHLI